MHPPVEAGLGDVIADQLLAQTRPYREHTALYPYNICIIVYVTR
jgi:hypothetical protein